MKILNFILALMFLAFAFVQINDPDPVLWILIYGNMAVLCVLAMFGMHFKIWIIVAAALYIVYAAILAPSAYVWFQSPDKAMLFDDLAKMQNLYIEETREFLGLVICLAVLTIHSLRSKKSN
ncbi:MAG: transmembrane 220 family protein [Cyclobacteriaceae bacterium]|nr:transmembrane 220 family protein [Cyclobacteriaceae bacterium]